MSNGQTKSDEALSQIAPKQLIRTSGMGSTREIANHRYHPSSRHGRGVSDRFRGRGNGAYGSHSSRCRRFALVPVVFTNLLAPRRLVSDCPCLAVDSSSPADGISAVASIVTLSPSMTWPGWRRSSLLSHWRDSTYSKPLLKVVPQQ